MLFATWIDASCSIADCNLNDAHVGIKVFVWDGSKRQEDIALSTIMSPLEIRDAIQSISLSLQATMPYTRPSRRNISVDDVPLYGGIAVIECHLEMDQRIIEQLQPGQWIRLRNVYLNKKTSLVMANARKDTFWSLLLPHYRYIYIVTSHSIHDSCMRDV
jgi:hypothetical protein